MRHVACRQSRQKLGLARLAERRYKGGLTSAQNCQKGSCKMAEGFLVASADAARGTATKHCGVLVGTAPSPAALGQGTS